MRIDGVRRLVKEHGVAGYLKIQAQMLGMDERGRVPRGRDGKAVFRESVTLPNGRKEPVRRTDEFSIRGLWEALVGPVSETLQYGVDQMGLIEVPQFMQEAVTSGAFPSAVGQLIAREVIEAYDQTDGFIGDQLMREFTSTQKDERIVGFTSAQGPKEVIEGEAYSDAGFTEKYVGSRQTKRGRLISITEESVVHDQTGQVLERARGIGEAARQDRERRIVWGVIDHSSTVPIYAPSGTSEQLYSSGNNNLRTTAVLADWTDIQETLDFHANNVVDDRQADDSEGGAGLPLVWTPGVLLTSQELAGTAARIVGAISVGDASNTVTTNPVNMIVPGGLKALSSPLINAATTGDQWDDNADWLLGDFRRQFRYKVIWPLQTFRAPAQSPLQFSSDVVAQFKVREYGDILSIDERWVVKNDAA